LPALFHDSPRSVEIAQKYHYPLWIVSRFLNIIPNASKLFQALESPPRKYIRINTLKTTVSEIIERLTYLGFGVRESILSDVLEITQEPFSLGSTVEHLLGYYYIQDLSSCLAVSELDVSDSKLVLDMTCAPGGKATYIAQKMNNAGALIAIDTSRPRIRSTYFNLMRCGIQNTHLFNMDAIDVTTFGVKFDRVLLDAPCSCEGVIPRDRSIKNRHTPSLIDRCAQRQLVLLDTAIRVTRPGGIVIYSTCTFAPEENELVVNALINSREDIHVEPINFGDDGLTSFSGYSLDTTLNATKRLYPHIHGTLGFYIAKLKVDFG
jgi:tRNA (cytosine40_48-C5)-methyltransferase